MEPKITLLKKLLVVFIIMMATNSVYSQNLVPFAVRPQGTFNGIKGDMLLIGNNVMNRNLAPNGPNVPFNGSGNNNSYNMQYVDIDGDASTFNSSTADLLIPVATQGCYQIRAAILYWAGVYNPANVGNQVDKTRLNRVRFRLPGAAYTDITGNLLYDSAPLNVSGNGSVGNGGPGYVAWADVTALVQGQANANGTYGVGNVQSGLGGNTSGGWSLYIVYEDPLTTAKNITLFDGFTNIRNGDAPINIPISGFTSIPVGPVRAKLAFSALEGDLNITGDRLRINGTSMTIPTRPATNFFNATINDINGAFTTRNLNSTNLLGFDAGIINVPNPGNSIIANSATSATIRLETGGDSYVYYLNAFAIEIIQPQINLVKTVTDLAGNDVGNTTVNLGQELFYNISFQNIGNDGATNFTITDLLPVNVTPTAIDVTGAPGVTHTGIGSNPIVFTVPNSLVTQGGATYNLRIRVRVAENCYDLRDACSNEITNRAFKTYNSLNSGNVVENQQPSASGIDACLFPTPGATNFIADIDDCIFTSEEVLCGNSVTLTAGGGYIAYQWHNGPTPNASNAIAGATSQSYTVNAVGTYSVVNTAPAPCLSITEVFNVVNFNGVVPNPVIPYADQVDTCPNDGSELPKIFLCGASDSRLIQTNILNATSIVWQVLNEASCPAVTNTSCANTNTSCTWNSAGPNGPNFNAVNAGQYRVTVTFQNGCFRTYYFNVYKNLFSPTAVATDQFCATPGTITVNGVPSSGYEFSLDNATWQPNNVFTPVAAGVYTVYVRQIGGGVGNCLFTIPNVEVINRNFTVTLTVNNALCNGGQGSIRMQVNNVRPQYTYQISGAASNTVGPINSNDYTFPNLNPGNYTVNVTTTDGCTFTQNVTITQPPLLTLTGAVTRPLTCMDPVTGLYDGQITLYPVGGTPPYIYTISSDPGNIYSNDPAVFDITTPGTYTFTVTDLNNCVATTTVDIQAIPPPVFTISQTNVLCNGQTTGQITFNVTNTNGYTIQYSIDNGGTFGTNPVFSNLPAGTYQTQLVYSLNGNACPPVTQTITITEPAAAVTAAVGVTELAGCGPNGEGRIRISNPSGGTPGYEYSFDGGATWGASNEVYLMPGTYNVCVRDTNLCQACYSVTIDPPPPAPTVTIVGPSYNCDGTGNITANTNSNGGNYSYTYYLDGIVNSPATSNVFSNIPCGPHNISIEYLNLTPPSTLNNLLIEDFGQGANTTSPGINTGFCWENQNPPSTCGNGIQINEGDYVVTRRINPIPNVWNDARDHTSNGTNANGRFFCVNLGTASPGRVLYSRTVNNIIPNINVEVSLWAMTLLQLGNTGQEPNLTVELVRDLGLPSETIVATANTNSIPKTINTWDDFLFSLNPGNNSTLSFVIRSYSVIPANEGVGVVIDDINLYQTQRVCSNTVTYPVNIECNQAFSAQITSASNVTCNGANDGQITIAAQNFNGQFYYSLTGAAPFTPSTTSPVTISGLAPGSYNVVIQYDLSATPCAFTFTQVISQPNALVASAVLSSPATCLNGGVITASQTGGTANYQYQLQDGVGGILVPYQSNNVFSNLIPGNYIVVVRDALLCTDPIDVAITIAAPTAPTAVIDGSSDLCYDGVNQATIVVTASGGVGPYTYSINGSNPPQTSNTFPGLTPGSYTITVTDSYGCTVTLPAVTIAPQLTASAVVTKALDCTASPNAVITVTINGGTSPYNYEVFFNAGSLGTFPVGSNPFTYSTANAGNYQFVITDFRGCTVTTSTVTISPLPILNPPVATPTAFNLCNGDSNGAFSVTASGGLPPYMYSNGGAFQSGNTFSGLTAGTYTVTVRDANFCLQTTSITLSQPGPIAFTIDPDDIQCGPSGTEPGSITVENVTGGTAGFTYYLTNSTGTYSDTYVATLGEDHSFSILNFGSYTVTVVDANGCQLTQNNIIIASPPNSLLIDVSTPTANCTTGGTIEVCVSAALGGGPYYFAIYQDLAPAMPPYPTYPGLAYQNADITGLCSTFTGLIPGVTYSFIVYDAATNCYYFETAPGPVPTPSAITSTITPNNVTCTGAADGSVSFIVSGYSGTSVSYQVYQALNNTPVGAAGTSSSLPVNGSFPVNNFGVLAPGQYYVLFTENNGPNAGCTQVSANFTISESPVPLSVTATVTRNDNDCTLNAGQITVTGANGTPPYTYQIVLVPGPAPLTWPGQSSNVFNVEGGTYDIYIQDANGCVRIATTPVTVPTDTAPDITIAIDPATLCNTNNGNYSIVVTTNNTVGVPPFTYSVDSGAFTTYATNPFTVSGLNSGSHTVTIRDANGCIETETIVINPPLNGTLTPTITATPNCGDSDGVITVTAGGGSGNYTYTISPPNVLITQAGNVFSNVPAGTYTVTITDVTTTCSIDRTITLAQPTDPNFTESVVDVTCNGASNGSITITLTGSNPDPVYTYAITAGPITFVPQNSNVFNNLPFGTYTVVVNSGRGCPTTRDIDVGQPDPIVVPAPTVTQFACNVGTNTSNNASIVVTGVTGGSGTYINYVFLQGGTVLQSGTSNTYTVSNQAGGTYTINVYDNNGCLGTNTVTINPFIRISNPTTSVAPGDEITCSTLESITVNVDATINGLATALPSPITYTVTGFAPSTYNVTQIDNPYFTGLGIGNYNVTVLNQTTGCSVQTIHYVFNPNTFVVNATVNNNVTCVGDNNGSVTFTYIDQNLVPSDDAGEFTYNIINTGTGLTVASGNSSTIAPFTATESSLPAGVYQIQTVLVNSPNCPAVTNFTISQPTTALTIDATSTPITCVPGSDGSISAVGNDGWGGPYEYQLEEAVAGVLFAWSSSPAFAGLNPGQYINLGPGTYTVSVRDNLTCEASATIVLSNPTTITASIAASPALLLCQGDNNGSITVSGTAGGFGSGYLYVLNNLSTGTSSAPQTSNIFTDLGAGNYSVTVSDSFGCSRTFGPVTIDEPTSVVEATVDLVTQVTCTTQATIRLSANGGTAPYRYSTTAGGSYVALVNPSVFSVPAGTYTYYVIDANDCVLDEASIIVEPYVPVVVTVDVPNAMISCNGGTATITATATNGFGNYVYTLNPNPAGVVQTSPGVFTNVPAGTYTVEVTTNGICMQSSTPVTISEPNPITYTSSFTDVTCASYDNGSITVVASGGTGTIQYSISSQQFQTVNSGVFTNLPPGNYIVKVQDQSGCFVSPDLTFTISSPTPIVPNSFVAVPERCLGDGGSIDFAVTGGTPDPVVGYTALVTYPDGSQTTQTSLSAFSFTNLPFGDYDFLITDANSCPLAFSFTLNPGTDIQGGAIIDYQCVNDNPNADVTITYNDVDLALADLTFDLDNGAVVQNGNNVFVNLTDGPHSVLITYNPSGCSQPVNFVVSLPTALTATALETGLNQFTIYPVGGVAPYTFTVSLNGTILYVGSDPVYFINQTGTYDILVTDANGCTATASIFIEFFDIEIPPYFTPVSGGWTPLYLDNFPNAVTYVFDRYSRKLITLRPGQSWDGTYNGNDLPSGDYWFVLKLNGETDAREFVGNFTLYR